MRLCDALHTNGARCAEPEGHYPTTSHRPRARHTCHATGCSVAVPPKMFMCRSHWYALPKSMRDAVWAAYVPGQERRKDPTVAYLDVTQKAIDWLAGREKERAR